MKFHLQTLQSLVMNNNKLCFMSCFYYCSFKLFNVKILGNVHVSYIMATLNVLAMM
jgi:hypothetical protein